MRRTFIDDALQADFDEYGFVVVPFLAPDEVQALHDLYWQVGPPPDDPRMTIYFDFQSSDAEFKRKMAGELRPFLEPRFEHLLDRHHLVYPNYIMKWPGERSGFAPHLDTSLVDESQFSSVTIWAPLTDTQTVDGEDNGILYVVPGSHRFIDTIRAHDPGSFSYAGAEQAIIEDYGVGVPVRAGEALVFDHRLIHFSMPNASTEPRLVIGLGLRPEEAQLLHYRRVGEDRYDVYAIDDEYYLRFNPFTLREGVPGYDRIETLDFTPPRVTLEEFDQLCAGVGPGPRSARDRYVRDANKPTRVNADPFCFRCGATEGLIGQDLAEHGNHQMLCHACGAGLVPAKREVGRVLLDDAQEAAMERDGFVVVTVPEAAVTELDALYRATRPAGMTGFLATTQTNDPDLKPRVHHGVCAVADTFVADLFVDPVTTAGNFVVKQPGPDVVVEPHQDLDFLDEARYRAVVAWVPLHDVDASGGGICVVPGSHKLATHPRGSGNHSFPLDPVAPHLREHGSVSVSLRRGEAVLYDARLLHWTPPNLQDHERVAAAFAVLPTEAQMRHHHLNPDGTVAVLAVDRDVYADTLFHGFPVRGTIVGVEPLADLPPYDIDSVDALLASTGATFPERPARPDPVAEPEAPVIPDPPAALDPSAYDGDGWVNVFEGGRALPSWGQRRAERRAKRARR